MLEKYLDGLDFKGAEMQGNILSGCQCLLCLLQHVGFFHCLYRLVVELVCRTNDIDKLFMTDSFPSFFVLCCICLIYHMLALSSCCINTFLYFIMLFVYYIRIISSFYVQYVFLFIISIVKQLSLLFKAYHPPRFPSIWNTGPSTWG